MSETSHSKRRHLTPPSPHNSHATTRGSSPKVSHQPRKKSRRGSPRNHLEGEESREHSLPESATRERSVPAQPGQEPSLRNSSIHGLDQMEPRDTHLSEADGEDLLEPSQQDTLTSSKGHRDVASLMPQNHQSRTADGASLNLLGPELSSFMDEFVCDAMALTPFNLPPLGESQGFSQHAPQFLGSSTVQPPTLLALQNGSDMPDTMHMNPTNIAHPSTPQSVGVRYQTQAQQSQPVSLSLVSQQGHPLPPATRQTFQTEALASEMPPYVHDGAQQAHTRTTNLVHMRQLQQFNQSAEQRLSSQEHAFPAHSGSHLHQTTSSAQRAVHPPQPDNLKNSAYNDTRPSQSTLNPSSRQYAQSSFGQHTQSTGPPPLSRPSHHHPAPTFPPAKNPNPAHQRTIPPLPQPRTLPPQTPAPQPSEVVVPQQLPSPQQQQQQQTTSLLQQQQRNHQAAIPIEPRILPSHYLWTQLTSAQLTMVGTLAELLVRTRNAATAGRSDALQQGGDVGVGELQQEQLAGGDVDEQQVRQVTSSLINIMSLWYLLRRERGWPL
jgi:hypothetical protein